MGSPLSTSIVYRPDIDGLRAIAVLSVFLYHLGSSTFSGGFVGVDVFFVISGFVITRLLDDELIRTGHLDFGKFYLRRARRLLPAFFFTLTFSTIFALWGLSPIQLANYGESLISAAFCASNVYFHVVSGYFDTGATQKPLLHTWSLGVEEQFYLIWPFLLSLFASRTILRTILTVGAGLASLCFANAILIEQPDAVFYLMPSAFSSSRSEQ